MQLALPLDSQLPFDVTEGDESDFSRWIAENNSRGFFWYRGNGAEHFELVPKVFRDKSLNEFNLCSLFMLESPGLIVESLPARNEFGDWLALMQHVGVPTRLLDWSAAALVGLWFACCLEDGGVNLERQDGVVYALNPLNLNKALCDANKGAPSVFRIDDLPVQRLLRNAMQLHKESSPFTVAAVQLPLRFRRQQAQHAKFTIHDDAKDLRQIANASTFLRAFRVPAEFKFHWREVLFAMGIESRHLFPELPTLAKFVELRAAKN